MSAVGLDLDVDLEFVFLELMHDFFVDSKFRSYLPHHGVLPPAINFRLSVIFRVIGQISV